MGNAQVKVPHICLEPQLGVSRRGSRAGALNYKFYARQRPGGSEGLVLQIKGRGSSVNPYYEILTPAVAQRRSVLRGPNYFHF